MQFSVNTGERHYGGSECENYKLHVITDVHGEVGDDFDFEEHPELFTLLTDMLLGQNSPIDIGDGTETYIYAGETIARLHLRMIAENWFSIDFTNSPWAEQIAELKCRFAQESMQRALAAGKFDITVRFVYPSPTKQLYSGDFTVAPEIERWLGEQLIAAANGTHVDDAVSIQVQRNRQFTSVD